MWALPQTGLLPSRGLVSSGAALPAGGSLSALPVRTRMGGC